MKKYLISYDLRKVGQNYKQLIAFIEQRLRATRVLQSVWVVECKFSAREILAFLEKLTDNNDGIVVLEIHPYADVASVNLLGRESSGRTTSVPKPKLGLFGYQA